MSERAEILQQIFNITSELSDCVKRRDFDDIQSLVDERQKLADKLFKNGLTDLTDSEKELISKIKEQKKIVLKLISDTKISTGQELKIISGNTKAVSAYRIMQNISPVLYNEKDMI